jgi:hypothetical protein
MNIVGDQKKKLRIFSFSGCSNLSVVVGNLNILLYHVNNNFEFLRSKKKKCNLLPIYGFLTIIKKMFWLSISIQAPNWS